VLHAGAACVHAENYVFLHAHAQAPFRAIVQECFLHSYTRTFYVRTHFLLVFVRIQYQFRDMAKLANAPILESPYQRSINAMVLLYDTMHSEYHRSIAMECFTQVAFRAWGWNVEKFYSEFKAAQNGQG
jgi:hypothetical protein